MPSLRQYRDRIVSVKNTRKITSAMKMVAAAKLKKAQDQAQAAQPYANAMAQMLSRLSGAIKSTGGSPLLVGTGSDQNHLIVVISSDRGLCGGFNANLFRFVRAQVRTLESEGKNVNLLCIGRKARDVLKREFSSRIVDSITGLGGRARLSYSDADAIAGTILGLFDAGKFDVCHLAYNEFKSVLTQKPSRQQIIPFSPDTQSMNDNAKSTAPYSFEPEEQILMSQLLPKNLSTQIFRALLDSAAGEQAARMTAMDNSTRNAGDLIKKLTLQYNRARQAHITKELIEIISGAEAI